MGGRRRLRKRKEGKGGKEYGWGRRVGGEAGAKGSHTQLIKTFQVRSTPAKAPNIHLKLVILVKPK